MKNTIEEVDLEMLKGKIIDEVLMKDDSVIGFKFTNGDLFMVGSMFGPLALIQLENVDALSLEELTDTVIKHFV